MFNLEIFAFMSSLTLGIGFIIRAVVFALLKEKGLLLIGGFYTLPKAIMEEYAKAMSRRMRNLYLLMSIILFYGAVLTYFSSYYFAAIAYVIVIALIVWQIPFLLSRLRAIFFLIKDLIC